MVTGFLDAITKVRQFRFHNDDDFLDRLSRRYSVVLLMLFTVVVSTKQYVGDRKYLFDYFFIIILPKVISLVLSVETNLKAENSFN